MDKSAFGAVSYDFSDPTVKTANTMTSVADEWSGGPAKQYLKSAFAGVMVPLDPKILQIQADLIRKGYMADMDTLAKVQSDDPGGDWQAPEDAMQTWYDEGGSYQDYGGYTLEPQGGNKYKTYLIAGGVLLGGLGLIWYLRK